MSLFEHIAATDDSHIVAHRVASAVALKRVRDRFGAFFANAGDDFPARLALVEDEITEIVSDVTSEHGGDAKKIEAAIKRAFGPMPPSSVGGGMPLPGQGAQMPGQMPGQQMPGQQTCPQCGAPMVDGRCPTCQGGGAGVPMAGYGQNHTIPQSPSTGQIQAKVAKGGFCDTCRAWKSGPKAGCTCEGEADGESDEESKDESKEASVHEARRPKMCPYHSEVVDISLGSGDPQAGFNAMSAHAWGDQHCKGGFEGNCNFRPAMVTQKFWDDKQAEYAERRQQRENPLAELSIETEPIMHQEPLPDEPGEEGVTDIDGELASAPSAVGAEPVMAATKRGEALKTVDLPKANDSGLGGPSPKIDKSNSGDQNGWSLDAIDTEMKGTPNPNVTQDVTQQPDYGKADFLDQTQAVLTTEKLPTDKADAGFDGERNIKQYPTTTFGDNGTTPVTRASLSAVDPYVNPIQEILDEYSGYLMPNQVENALQDWEVG